MMADSADDFGERAATAAEVADWITLTRQARRASHGYKARRPEEEDSMRPSYGSGRASSEGDE